MSSKMSNISIRQKSYYTKNNNIDGLYTRKNALIQSLKNLNFFVNFVVGPIITGDFSIRILSQHSYIDIKVHTVRFIIPCSFPMYACKHLQGIMDRTLARFNGKLTSYLFPMNLPHTNKKKDTHRFATFILHIFLNPMIPMKIIN